jgi:hypothetical protein
MSADTAGSENSFTFFCFAVSTKYEDFFVGQIYSRRNRAAVLLTSNVEQVSSTMPDRATSPRSRPVMAGLANSLDRGNHDARRRGDQRFKSALAHVAATKAHSASQRTLLSTNIVRSFFTHFPFSGVKVLVIGVEYFFL